MPRGIMACVRPFVAAAALAFPAIAAAQPLEKAPPELFRRWDAGAGFTIRFGEGDDRVVPLGSWIVQAGRYWTPHLKTSIEVMTAGQSSFGSHSYTGVSSTSTEYVTGSSAYGADLTYQFFDNEFVHPYVTAGARFASSRESVVINTYSPGQPYTSVTMDGPNRLATRPVVGGGFKSYFANGQAFMRTELLFVIGPNDSRHAVFQIGWGVDF
jgi:hypothetical protein